MSILAARKRETQFGLSSVSRSRSKPKNAIFNPASKSAAEDQGKQAKAVIQLNVFDVARPPKLQIQRVPLELAIAPDRFYLEVEQRGHCWCYPIQFTKHESRWIYAKVKDLNWSLNGNGVPVEAALIHQTVELLVDGGAGA